MNHYERILLVLIYFFESTTYNNCDTTSSIMSISFPRLYNDSESNEISQTKHSVYNRFRCVIKNHTELTVDKYAYVDLLICWRNNTIHFDAENPLLPESLNYFKKTANNDTVAKLYHLDVSKMLIHFKNGDCPTFKEIATLISMTIHFVEELDNILLHDIQQYQFLGNTLLHLITKDNKNTSVFDFANATPEKRKEKIVQFFITHGITEDFYNDDGKEFLDYVSTITEDEFKAQFKPSNSL